MRSDDEAGLHFSPDDFFARAATRLHRGPQRGADRFIDRQLNIGVPDPTPEMRFRDAAILVPIVDRLPEPSVILTQRTTHLPQHAGQVAFPGGKVDPSDASPTAAAIREAEEEIGLQPDLVEPIGFLDTYVTHTGFRLYPLVAKVAAAHTISPNPGEVAAVFEVPLSFLMEPRNHGQGTWERQGGIRRFYEMPYNGYRIWGITAGIIRLLYEKIFD